MFIPRSIALVLAALVTVPSIVMAQDELKPEVPALDEFHTVVAKIWHTAWPDGNVQMLADLMPEVEDLGGKLAEAKLPGILRDKQAAWDDAIADLRSILDEYKSAAVPIDSERMMNAAESLHSQFEKLARLLQPPLPELESFHGVLYMLYHHYVPDGDRKRIDSCSAELKTKMTMLDSTRLPERFAGRARQFGAARRSLSDAVNAFIASVGTGDMNEIKTKLETMHTRYQELEKVMEE